MSKRLYIRLLIYDYDSSPRCRWVEHDCKSMEHALHILGRLQKLMGLRYDQNRTGRWVERNLGIYGFIERIDGIYEETTRKVA